VDESLGRTSNVNALTDGANQGFAEATGTILQPKKPELSFTPESVGPQKLPTNVSKDNIKKRTPGPRH